MFFARSNSVSSGQAPFAAPGLSPPLPSTMTLSPGSRSLWNSVGSAVEDDGYSDMLLGPSSSGAGKRQRSFSMDQTSPRMTGRDLPSQQPRIYHTPGAHLLACEEEEEDDGMSMKTKSLGAIGCNIQNASHGFGLAISPVSSRDSSSSSTSHDGDEATQYFCCDDTARNMSVNSEVLGIRRTGGFVKSAYSPITAPLGAPPSPPVRPYDVSDYSSNPAAFINAPSQKLYFVQFKASRLDVFFIPDASGLSPAIGDYVIVDADRGRDLGRVIKTNVTAEEAGLLKLKRHQEQQAILQHVPGSPGAGTADKGATSATPGVCTPKQILRFAQKNEVSQIVQKKNDEDKAVSLCLQKVGDKNLAMSVLDAEYQWDRRKLTFFYNAGHRIDFRELVRELFRIYKTRIWMCAVGAADESNNEMSGAQQQQQQQQQHHHHRHHSSHKHQYSNHHEYEPLVSPGTSPTGPHYLEADGNNGHGAGLSFSNENHDKHYGITTSKLFGGGPMRYA